MESGIIFFLSILVCHAVFDYWIDDNGGAKRITMRHSRSGLLKSGYVNYCWTYFFIGWMVPIVRGEIGIGMLHLALTFSRSECFN